ncbi:hypothetical protein [Pseudomonas amygdali]|uniref:hypothetical protein n=1 Tax=Pseudomonas amygdali TaxID=47877 RepID=UPI0011AF054C|nr:hypothetical protein [Pseudomonas amygdali]
MMIEAQGEQRLKTINRVKETRVIDLTQLAYEDVQLYCSQMPSRFLDTLQRVFQSQASRRAGMR